MDLQRHRGSGQLLPGVGGLDHQGETMTDQSPEEASTHTEMSLGEFIEESAIKHGLVSIGTIQAANIAEDVTKFLAPRTLPDPNGGCACTPHSQDAGGGYVEHLLEYEPACPIHSVHLYDPESGEWVLRERYTRDAQR